MNGIDYFIQDLAVILAVAGLVGWVCQRLGMSVVVGFLVAGIVVGPHSPVIPLVSPDDGVERIETLAQNEVGQSLYPSLGFVEIARQIHYAQKL